MRDFILSNIEHSLFGQPWAILPAKLEEIVAVFDRRRAGIVLGDAELAKIREEAKAVKSLVADGKIRDVVGMPVTMVGRTAILPMHGTICQRPGIFTRFSGGTSAEQFATAHEHLVADPGVKSVVWNIDSPGGSVSGLPEAFDRLMAVRGRKKTTAVSDTLMCSAAYYLGCAADEVIGTPSSLTGSIGTIMAHADFSKQNEQDGVKVTYISAGKYKAEANPDEPLADSARSALQQMVDDYYGQFAQAVARARSVSEKTVRGGYGEGRALHADRALAAGLIDRIEPLGAVLKRLGAYEPDRSASATHARLRVAEAEVGLSRSFIKEAS